MKMNVFEGMDSTKFPPTFEIPKFMREESPGTVTLDAEGHIVLLMGDITIVDTFDLASFRNHVEICAEQDSWVDGDSVLKSVIMARIQLLEMKYFAVSGARRFDRTTDASTRWEDLGRASTEICRFVDQALEEAVGTGHYENKYNPPEIKSFGVKIVDLIENEEEPEYSLAEIDWTGDKVYLSFFRDYRFQVSGDKDGNRDRGSSRVIGGISSHVRGIAQVDKEVAKDFINAQVLEALFNNSWTYLDISANKEQIDKYIGLIFPHLAR